MSHWALRLGFVPTDEEYTSSSSHTKVASLASLTVNHLLPSVLGLRPLLGLALVRFV